MRFSQLFSAPLLAALETQIFVNNLQNWWLIDPPSQVKFLWLFSGSEVCLPGSATATQLCRRYHQYAHSASAARCPDACRLFRTSPPVACWCCSSFNLCLELCYKLPSVATFTFIQIFDQSFVSFTEQCQSCRVCLIQRQNSRYFRCPVWKTKSLKATLHENWNMQTLF